MIASVPWQIPDRVICWSWYLDAQPMCLTVTATPVNSAKSICLWSQELAAADFGKSIDLTEVTWETAGLTAGQYVICARIIRHPGEILAEKQSEILLTSTEVGTLIGKITTDQITYRHHESACLTSTVEWLSDRASVVKATVEVVVRPTSTMITLLTSRCSRRPGAWRQRRNRRVGGKAGFSHWLTGQQRRIEPCKK